MEWFNYLLKLSISLAVVYGFYWLLLRRLTFYNWNRWFLLLYPAVTFLIPFVNVGNLLQRHDMENSVVVSYIPLLQLEAAKPANTFDVYTILLGVLVAGSFVMLIKLLIQYWSLRRIRSEAVLLADEGVKLYHINKSVIPFSFGNSIYFNRELHTETELKEIIRHEFIHVKQRHSLDILWGELLCLLNWYNPFAWLIRKAIRQNLEFIADRQVLASGLDRKQYQYILLKVTGISSYSIVSNFNFSSLKNRIAMMNRSKSARMNLARFILILPLLAIVLLAFRSVVNNQKRSVNKIISVIDNSDIPKTITDTTPVRQNDEQVKNTKQIEHLEATGHKWTLTLKDGSVEKYDLNNAADKKAFEKKYGTIKLPNPPVPTKPPQPSPAPSDPGPVKELSEKTVIGKPAPTPPTPPGAPAAPNFVIRNLNDTKPLVIFNDVEFEGGMEALNKVRNIDPNEIQEINVLKDKTAVDIYGEKGKNGVIIIYSKDYKLRPITVNGRGSSNAAVSGSGSVSISVNGTDPDVIVDSAIVSADEVTFDEGNSTVSADKMTIRDLKGKLSLDNYSGSIMVDGKKYTSDEFKKLNLKGDQIESVDVLKHAVSHDKQNIPGGVIIIKTKKNRE